MKNNVGLNIPIDMLLDETQNEYWFQIVNTVEDMSNEPTWDEVIKLLKTQFIVIPIMTTNINDGNKNK